MVGARLRPLAPEWVPARSFDTAAAALRAAGSRVAAWVVLTHNSRLGAAFPDVAVVNCFGERYPYALCPAWPEVREYAVDLAREAAAGADEVSLEACGQLGLVHGSHHEKTDGAWTPAAVRWLSVCCCPACQRDWASRGLDPPWVVSTLRDAVRTEVSVPFADALLATRHASTDLLREAVLSSIDVPVTLHAHPDPWATGASPGLTPTAAASVSALVVPAWPTTPDTADLIAQAARAGRPVDAYVTVLPPAEPAGLREHARRLRTAGATGVSLYHLGLAPRWRQPLLRELARLWA